MIPIQSDDVRPATRSAYKMRVLQNSTPGRSETKLRLKPKEATT
jgi:hypothetical protein